MTCNKCNNFIYNGETERKANVRFREHKGYVINKMLEKPTGEHFNTKGHSFTDMRFMPFEKVHGDGIMRLIREKHWQVIYGSVEHGANKRYN